MKITKRYAWIALVFLLPAVLLLGSCSARKSDSPQPAMELPGPEAPRDEIVATVNGSPIYVADLNLGVTRYQQKLASSGKDPDPAKRNEQLAATLELLIENELLFQEARRRGFSAVQAEVDKEMEFIAGQFPGSATFEKSLALMNVTKEDLRKDLERAQAVQSMIAGAIEPTVKVNAEEVRAYYEANPKQFTDPERVRARHIFLKVVPNTTEEQKAEMRRTLEELRRRALQGESFEALADQYSQDPVAEKGGDLGYFAPGQLTGDFGKAVYSLKTGEISGVVSSIYGYHLIQVTERQPATLVSFERVRESLTGHLRRRKVDEAVSGLTKELRDKATIVLPKKSK